MAVSPNLTSRQLRVLGATVRHYIATAEPVGSRTLVEEFDLSASPATIRNTMGMLEKCGLLYQPHTSAGRVPSDSGYRLYVDQLLQPSPLTPHPVEQLLEAQLNWRDWSLEVLLRGAAQILSSLSGYISVVSLPQPQTAYLRHLQLVSVGSERVMLIAVTDTFQTQSTLINLPSAGADFDEARLEQELNILSNFLNAHLRGRSLAELTQLNWSELGQEFQRYTEVLLKSITELTCRSYSPASTQLLVSGVAEVLRQPEFNQLQQVQMLLHLLEETPDQLWPLMFEAPHSEYPEKRVAIWIGSENPLESMRTCTLIASTYRRGEVPLGSVAMIGPTRMVYENAIAVVEAAADYLSEALSQE
jgi:heat-inducible transcriptional repressor